MFEFTGLKKTLRRLSLRRLDDRIDEKMSESFKVRSGLYQSSKSSTSDSINNHQVINLLGSMKGRCVAKEASTPTGWMEAMLSRLTTQKSDRQKASHPKEKGERKSKVVELRYSKLSLEDRQYLKSQMAIWFPCVVHRPTLSELEAALAEMGSRIMRGVTAFHAMDLNPGLTESKVQRQLFRNRHRSLKQRDVQLLMSTWCRKTVDLAGCAEECGKLERKLTSMSLVSAKLNTLCAKKSSNSFINGEKNWRHSLMSCDVETSSVSSREEMRANCDVDQVRLLLLYDKRTYDVPRWFHWLVEKGATIDLELIHPEPVDGPVVEARELLERPRRISLHIMPPGISSMVKGRMFVSIIEQEQMRPVVNKCVNISTNNVASSSPAKTLLMSRKTSKKTLSLHRPEKDLESETTTKTCAHCESWYEQNDERSSQDDFFPEERTISFEHKWAYVLPKHGVKFKKSKLKQKKNIKVPQRFDLKIPYDKESSVLINTESQNDAKAQLDIPVNKQTGRESEKSNVEIRSAVKALSNKFSRKLRNLLRKSFRNSSHSAEVVKTKTVHKSCIRLKM
ncbi:hypothetical protein Btru_006678 [Bulinus truncatus]|nr:hypothetical protein Btru_006678 [Bulinus truncatus]